MRQRRPERRRCEPPCGLRSSRYHSFHALQCGENSSHVASGPTTTESISVGRSGTFRSQWTPFARCWECKALHYFRLLRNKNSRCEASSQCIGLLASVTATAEEPCATQCNMQQNEVRKRQPQMEMSPRIDQARRNHLGCFSFRAHTCPTTSKRTELIRIWLLEKGSFRVRIARRARPH